jgi:hypothetical protein
MNDDMTASQYTTRTPNADGKRDEPSLLVLALLEQLCIDRAHGRYYDFADYYAANPELEDEFLAMALAALRDHEGAGSDSGSQEQEDNVSGRRPLSSGVLRALARIPELSSDVAGSEEHRVAESRAPYAADEEQ